MQGHSLVYNGNPDGTAKNVVPYISPGTIYRAEVFNDNFGNMFNVVKDAGYNLIAGDLSQLTKALRGNYVASYVYNTSSLPTQTVDDIVRGSDNRFYRCKTNGTTGDNPVGSITGNWEILPINADTLNNLTSNDFVTKTGVQALHPTDALRISGTTLSLYKGDGSNENVIIPLGSYVVAEVLGSVGYRKWNSGHIEQWIGSSNLVTTETINFPFSFPTECYQVQVTTVAGTPSYASVVNYNQTSAEITKSVAHGVRLYAIGR